MTTILHIDSSILGGASTSRALTAGIVARLLTQHPGARVIHHDLVAEAPLHLSDAHLAVFQGGVPGSPALGQDLALGGGYLAEVLAAEIIVIGAPMYNFTVPSQLKAWIDRICVAGQTFRYEATGPVGLLTGRKVFVASTRGGIYTGASPAAALDHQESYLRGVLGFIGLTDVTFLRAEGLNFGPDAKAGGIAQAEAEIAALAA